MALWVVAGLALIVALAALAAARRAARRLETLNQSYWELRYDFTRLRSQVSRLDPESEPAQEPALPRETVAFVPLTSIKKKG